MSKLEELLNKIREKGWKPRGLDGKVYILDNECNRNIMIGKMTDKFDTYNGFFTLNDLCSLDSGLWQFVCKEGLYNKNRWIMPGYFKEVAIGNVDYYLMGSSIQERKEQFLLDNIRIDEPN